MKENKYGKKSNRQSVPILVYKAEIFWDPQVVRKNHEHSPKISKS